MQTYYFRPQVKAGTAAGPFYFKVPAVGNEVCLNNICCNIVTMSVITSVCVSAMTSVWCKIFKCSACLLRLRARKHWWSLTHFQGNNSISSSSSSCSLSKSIDICVCPLTQASDVLEQLYWRHFSKPMSYMSVSQMVGLNSVPSHESRMPGRLKTISKS